MHPAFPGSLKGRPENLWPQEFRGGTPAACHRKRTSSAFPPFFWGGGSPTTSLLVKFKLFGCRVSSFGAKEFEQGPTPAVGLPENHKGLDLRFWS